MIANHTSVVVARLPLCDVCSMGCPACKIDANPNPNTARFDARTIHRPWANLCPDHFRTHAYGLGLGDGQVLLLAGEHLDDVRRFMVDADIPAHDLAADKGQTWSTDELQRDFEVEGFAAPFVVVRRKSDGAMGTLEFTHSPRVYFGWQAE